MGVTPRFSSTAPYRPVPPDMPATPQAAPAPSSSRGELFSRWLLPLVVAGGWFVAVVFAVNFVERDAMRYLDWSQGAYQRFWPNRWLLAVHISGAAVALLVGPTQFSKTLRRKIPRAHRMAGWLYVTAVLVSTPVAMRLATDSCALCVLPFEVWGIVTIVFTVIAVLMAVMGNYKAHKDFMIRSYVMMYAFVIVRLDTHAQGTFLEIPLPEGVERSSMVLWYAWVIPLLVVEAGISWFPTVRRVMKRRSGPRRTASD